MESTPAMIFNRKAVFRRPRVGPKRQTRLSRYIEIAFVLIAKATLGLATVAFLAFCLLTEGAGATGHPTTRKGWAILIAITIFTAAIIVIFLYFVGNQSSQTSP